MNYKGLLALLLLTLPSSALPQVPDNPHSAEPIATVREVYDGTFLPDIGANTFRNIDRLFSTRIVKAGEDVYALPRRSVSLGNFTYESRGSRYDYYDYLSLNRVVAYWPLKTVKLQ